MDAAVVRELRVYPVKGCRGVSVTAAGVGRLGLNWDRRWMVVNGGMTPALMQTQRNAPVLATLVVDVLVGGSSALAPVPAPAANETTPGVVLRLARSDATWLPAGGAEDLPASIDVPLKLAHGDGDAMTAAVWGSEIVGVVDQGDDVANVRSHGGRGKKPVAAWHLPL